MPRTEQIQIKLDPGLKAEAEAVLARLGLKPTEFIRMALRQLVACKGLPFDAHVPNAQTIAALEESPEHLRRFGSVREMFADIETRGSGK